MHLTCHPAHPCAFIERFEVHVTPQGEHTFALRYSAIGDIEQVRFPPPRSSCRANRLWQHTCCEAFIRVGGERAYSEFNFSPSTCWAAYRFDDYRLGMQELDLIAAPAIAYRHTSDRLEFDVQFTTGPTSGSEGARRMALAAVIEDRDGNLSYWALAHPSDKPDFHHDDAFRLEIE